MTELLTVLIGLTWILALVGVPVGLASMGLVRGKPDNGVADAVLWTIVVPLAGCGLVWLCYRVGLTVRPWLVEVLK
jgi:hypothetical protein